MKMAPSEPHAAILHCVVLPQGILAGPAKLVDVDKVTVNDL